MSIPDNLKYTKDHEWIRIEGEFAFIGITHHAQDQLGDVVFIELPDVGTEIAIGDTFGTVESVKAVSDLFAPVEGQVAEINEALADGPEVVNSDPYGDGWMIKVKLAGETKDLMSAADYTTLVAG